MHGKFVFGGVSSDDLKLIVDGSGVYPTPERDVEMMSVPGRNGDLIIDNGRYKNISISYNCLIRQFEKTYEAMRVLLASKTGYERLEDTYNPDKFRIARISGGIEPTPGPHKRTAQITLTFECKPQFYVKAGETPIDISSGTVLYNKYGYEAKPIISVTGSGTLTVGNTSIKCGRSMTIDCEAQDCYGSNGENLNSQATLNGADFPTLQPGENGITFTGFSKVTIAPRWWTL